MEPRGEVRRLADVFGEEEVEKASLRLRSAAEAFHSTLQTLENFLRDNQQISKLVQELPAKVSYPVMVPFGKAAFFSGKLLHTNEYLVLLGEGYYAECSASKTLEILGRRGQSLSTQIARVKSQLAELDVESHFFNETFAEAAAGCVEIREEFVESPSSKQEPSNYEESDSVSKTDRLKKNMLVSTDDDKEHELLMARLDEIAAAEAASEELWTKGSSGHSTVEKQDEGRASIEHGAEQLVDELGDGVESRPNLMSPGDLVKFEQWRRGNSRRESTNQITEIRRKPSMLLASAEDVDEPAETHRLRHNGVSTSQSEGQGTAKDSTAEKAFTGNVIERSGQTLVELPQGARRHQARPVSKFKQRQADK